MSYSFSPCRLGADSHPLLHTGILHMFSEGSVCLPLVTVLVCVPCGALGQDSIPTADEGCLSHLSLPHTENVPS